MAYIHRMKFGVLATVFLNHLEYRSEVFVIPTSGLRR